MSYPSPDSEEARLVPEEVLVQLHYVQWELTDAASTYSAIEHIYPADKDALPLLRRCSAFAFDVIYKALMERYILTLSRLIDPSRTGKQENLSLFGLGEALETSSCPIATAVVQRLDDLSKEKKSLKAFRNQVLAHNDLLTNAQEATHQGVKYGQLTRIRSTGEAIVNDVRSHYGMTPYCFDMLIGCDATGVLKSLRRLEEFDNIRRDVVRSTRMSDDVLRRRIFALRRG